MSLLRRIGVVTAVTLLGVVLTGTAARADWTSYRTDPSVIACWQKVNAYGGVYQVSNGLLNSTAGYHTVRVTVYRPGVGLIADQTYTSSPGEWKLGVIANVALVPDDEYDVDLDGVRAVGIPAHGIPYYMDNCKVTDPPSPALRTAINFGLAQLDSIYTGCNGGTYRFGTVAPYAMTHYGASCGQHNYYQPAGTKGYDCSGLIYKMFQAAGVYFPWTSSITMNSAIPTIPKSQIRVGDLLVKNGHVAMYLGDGDSDGVASVLEASPKWTNPDGSKTGVVISDATGYMNDPSFTAHRVSGT